MKIAVLGSAPSSLKLAPFGDPSWKIWACSPAVYPQAPRVDAWFEIHRWEPGEVGKPATQKGWLSPEYVQWMGRQQCPVWMERPVPEIPNSMAIPWQQLCRKYGAYNFTSTLAYMFAMAIDAIGDDRSVRDVDGPVDDSIGLWGVDMSAHEEYGYQRAGMQFLIQLAANLDINVVLPPESDLLQHPPLYGISESWPVHIKLMERHRELKQRVDMLTGQIASAEREKTYIQGALDDVTYMMGTWVNVEGNPAFNLKAIQEDAQNMNPPELTDAVVNIADAGGMKD